MLVPIRLLPLKIDADKTNTSENIRRNTLMWIRNLKRAKVVRSALAFLPGNQRAVTAKPQNSLIIIIKFAVRPARAPLEPCCQQLNMAPAKVRVKGSPCLFQPSGWRKLRNIVQWTPFFQTYKKQRYPWVQLAGHQGNFKAGPDQGTILKKLCVKEERCFKVSDVGFTLKNIELGIFRAVFIEACDKLIQ